jgi:uncharacterized protein YqeY
MGLKEKIEAEMIPAAKAKDALRLSAIRMIKTALHNKEIDLRRSMEDAEVLQVLASLVKQRTDSIEQFKKGNRQDLVEKERAELKIIKEFMPAEMSEQELDAVIESAIQQLGACGVKDMGKVMKALMPKITGKADGKMVSDKVKAKLSA